MIVESFLLGYIAACCIVATLFFLKFWRRTGDSLFLMFAIAFAIECGLRLVRLPIAPPGEASVYIYVVRALGYLLLLIGMIRKNLNPSD